MILNMKGEDVTNLPSERKVISIELNPYMENASIEDFVNNYLVPFMNKLEVPVINLYIHE